MLKGQFQMLSNGRFNISSHAFSFRFVLFASLAEREGILYHLIFSFTSRIYPDAIFIHFYLIHLLFDCLLYCDSNRSRRWGICRLSHCNDMCIVPSSVRMSARFLPASFLGSDCCPVERSSCCYVWNSHRSQVRINRTFSIVYCDIINGHITLVTSLGGTLENDLLEKWKSRKDDLLEQIILV